MAITVTVRMGDDITNPIVEKTAVHILIAGLDPWTSDPTEDDPSNTAQAVYRVVADAPSGDDGASHAFTPSAEGDHEWDGYIFPVAGAWSLKVYSLDENGDLDSAVKTQAVTVVADS